MKQNQKGFTLIELLVVVAIIGLLASVIVVSLNNARAKARDAKRLADVKSIQNALEMYYADNNAYPTVATDTLASTALATPLASYLASIPVAPTPFDNSTGTACSATNNAYMYASATPSSTYTLKFCLGGPTGGFTIGAKTASPAGITPQ